MMSNNTEHEIEKVGIFTPKPKDVNELNSGEIGFIITGIKNLSETEQTTFNNLVEGGTLDEAKFAVSGLMMKAGMNFNSKQPELFEGTSDVTSSDAFGSVAQVTDAMNDPRYEKDPAYRKKVADKLGRSTVI